MKKLLLLFLTPFVALFANEMDKKETSDDSLKKTDDSPKKIDGFYIEGHLGFAYSVASNIKNISVGDQHGHDVSTYKLNKTSFDGCPFAARGVLGYSLHGFDVPLRFDLSYMFVDNIVWKDHNYFGSHYSLNSRLYSQTILFNIYYDFFRYNIWSTYISAGCGYGYIKAKTSSAHDHSITRVTKDTVDSSNNFSFDGAIGELCHIAENIFIDMRYQFTYVGDLKLTNLATYYTNDDMKLDIKRVYTNVFTLGVGFSF